MRPEAIIHSENWTKINKQTNTANEQLKWRDKKTDDIYRETCDACRIFVIPCLIEECMPNSLLNSNCFVNIISKKQIN